MKNFKLSMLVMLSAIAMTFTSCLGDGDNTQYVMGTGTVSSSSATLLDNGLTIKSSVWGNAAVGDRIYVYASVPGDEYEAAIANLQAGKSASVNLANLYQAGVLKVIWKNLLILIRLWPMKPYRKWNRSVGYRTDLSGMVT